MTVRPGRDGPKGFFRARGARFGAQETDAAAFREQTGSTLSQWSGYSLGMESGVFKRQNLVWPVMPLVLAAGS
jgi:hypothetical protein